MRHFCKYDLIPLLSMAAVCAFPCVFLYARNAAEVPASAMVPFLIVFLVNALAFFLIALPVFRNASRAAFWTDLAMLVVINFCLLAWELKKLMPFLRDRYLLAVLLALLLALAAVLIRKKPDLRTGCLLLLIAFGSMTAVNLVLAVPKIITSHEVRAELEHAPDPDAPPPAENLEGIVFPGAARPNVYWFMFDEYGGYDNLRLYYDYDNDPFLRELEDRGFSVSRHSRNTEAVATDTIMPNLLNLSYVVRVEDSGHRKKVFRNNPQLYRMFRGNGYQVNLINHTDYLGTEGVRVLTSHQTRRTISEYLMRNSIYNKSPALRWMLDQFFTMDYGANYRAGLDNAMAAGLSCAQAAGDRPTLTIGYYQFPHSPTMVGPNGEELPYEEGWNWRRHELYLGQVAYCNKFILNLVDTIRAQDPEALIFLQSDHGNRYALHMVQLEEWPTYDPHVENPKMQNILNCVYYQGQRFDIEGKTGVNTMRTVLDRVFGTALGEIPPVEDYSMGEDEKS